MEDVTDFSKTGFEETLFWEIRVFKTKNIDNG